MLAVKPIAPARAFLPVVGALVIGGALMFARARYVESCWATPLIYFHRHCVPAYMYDRRIDGLAFVYIGAVFVSLLWLALRTCDRKVM